MPRILLVESDIRLGNQYEQILSECGLEVKRAKTAQSAILAADKKMPDLVILEILLPGHNGIEFMHEFRSYAEWRHIPIIILSRMTKEKLGASDKALAKLGVIEFLYKPETSLNRLCSRVESALISLASANHESA